MQKRQLFPDLFEHRTRIHGANIHGGQSGHQSLPEALQGRREGLGHGEHVLQTRDPQTAGDSGNNDGQEHRQDQDHPHTGDGHRLCPALSPFPVQEGYALDPLLTHVDQRGQDIGEDKSPEQGLQEQPDHCRGSPQDIDDASQVVGHTQQDIADHDRGDDILRDQVTALFQRLQLCPFLCCKLLFFRLLRGGSRILQRHFLFQLRGSGTDFLRGCRLLRDGSCIRRPAALPGSFLQKAGILQRLCLTFRRTEVGPFRPCTGFLRCFARLSYSHLYNTVHESASPCHPAPFRLLHIL